jgi:cell division septation protein DedD
MRTAFEEEEELAPNDPRQKRGEDHEQDYGPEGPDRELTISSTTLLAIFFGLVLICGLFFGFGYTLGRRSNSEASQLPAVAPVSEPQSTISASKPSAASQSASTATPAAPEPPATDASASPAADSEPQEDTTPAKTPETPASPAPQVVKPALPLVAQTTTPASQAAAATTPAPSGIMVQIAAISNPTDAGVLVGALQKRGYSVTARHLPSDPLIHVQVGPFSNRADAIAMRQKLLGDGYNAILK